MALNEFISTIIGKDLARQNRFEIEITGPGGMANREVNLLCESVSMPGQNIRTTEDDLRFGPARDHAQAFTYGDISLTFICTPGMPEKFFFEEWQKLIVSKGNSEWQAKFYNDYKGTILIHQLDRKDNRLYTVKVHEAFPKTINAQEFSLSSNDTYQTVSVDFAYRWWETIQVKEPLPAPASLPPPQVDAFEAFTGGRGNRHEVNAVDTFIRAHRGALATGADLGTAGQGTIPGTDGKAIT